MSKELIKSKIKDIRVRLEELVGRTTVDNGFTPNQNILKLSKAILYVSTQLQLLDSRILQCTEEDDAGEFSEWIKVILYSVHDIIADLES